MYIIIIIFFFFTYWLGLATWFIRIQFNLAHIRNTNIIHDHAANRKNTTKKLESLSVEIINLLCLVLISCCEIYNFCINTDVLYSRMWSIYISKYTVLNSILYSVHTLTIIVQKVHNLKVLQGPKILHLYQKRPPS